MMERLEFLAEGQERLDVFLSREMEITRSRVKTLVENGAVFYNGKAVKKCGECLKGGLITVQYEEPSVLEAVPEDIPVDIVYEDADLAVINKQQGLVTHPAAGTPNGTLVNALLFHIKDLSGINGVIRPGIVHRLDKDTSGLLVVAKNDRAHLSLAEQIGEKRAGRYYTALLQGNLTQDTGEIDRPIGRSKRDRKLMAVDDNGRKARTSYTVLERFSDYTLVEFKLSTGRTHQIRVHAKYLGHPVVGDTAYGKKDSFGLSGQLLHAHRLEFTHPITGQQMTFTAPLPDYFLRVLQKLRT